MQLCGAGACHALREQLCVRRWTPPCHDMVDEDSELACQFHTQGQGNGFGELLDREPIALEHIILDGSCGEAVRARYTKVARARSSRLELLVWAQSSFFEFGVEPSTMSLKFARRWGKYRARLANLGRSVVNETPVMMARETFLERLYRFNQHLLLPRLAHLGADATTPTQRPRIRIVQQKLVPGFRRAYSIARHGGPSGFGAWAGHLRFRGRGYQREHDASDVQALFASLSVLRAIQRLFVSSLVPLPHRPAEQ